MRPPIPPVTLLAIVLVALGCEPASVTDARDQLGREPARTVQLSIPIIRDTLAIVDVFTDLLNVTTTTIGADSLLAVVVDQQTFTVSTGDSIGSISGPLDPALLTFAVEEWQEVPSVSLNLGEFESAVRDATINAALAVVMVSNSADAPLTVSNFTLGVVRLDAGGQPVRDVGGNLMYEQDAGGNPILVDVEDSPGAGVFTITRAVGGVPSVRVDTIQAAALVDRLVDLLLDGNRAALAGAGTVSVGDGSVGTVSTADQLLVVVEPIIGLDMTVPAIGVSFDSSTVGTGLNLDPRDADSLASRLDSATAVLALVNGAPFALEMVIALVEDSITGDVFTAPGRILLDTLNVVAPSLDANGRVTQPTSDTVTVRLTGDGARQLFGQRFTAGIRVRLLPPPGGRGAIRISDAIQIRATASVFLQSGGSQ